VVNKEDEDEKEQGVENIVKAGSGFRGFPFAFRDDIVSNVDKVLRPDPT